MIPEQGRIAIHQAGHPVVQTLVSRGRYRDSQASLNGPCGGYRQGRPARGESLIDGEIIMGPMSLAW